MIVKLLTEHHVEFLSLSGGCRGSSESTHVNMQHCWKSHAMAHLSFSNHFLLCDLGLGQVEVAMCYVRPAKPQISLRICAV